MIVDLRKLKPNPLRDFKVDPIDAERVDELSESIRDDGFWGGVVCRRVNGHFQIGAGHHRVHAAIKAGMKTADVFVGDFDDAGMVRVYARENATQRGNTSTSQAGTVASAIRFVAKSALGGGGSGQLAGTSLAEVRGNLASDKGIGREVLSDLLVGIPGINEKSIRQQLAALKSSGDYARIIAEVKAEIEREQKEALAALARAEKAQAAAEEAARKAEAERKAASDRAKAAREKADRERAVLERQRTEALAKLAEKRRKEAEAEMEKFAALKNTRDTAEKAVAASAARPVTFDFEGVSKHLKNAHQVEVFRTTVTGQGIAPYLPVAGQEALAGELVRLAKTRKAELTGAFIRENISTLVLQAKQTERNFSREERDRMLEEDLRRKVRHLQDEFIRGVRLMVSAATDLAEFQRDSWPKGKPFPVFKEFSEAVTGAKRLITKLERSI